jgi:NaMN:DMB phosphoribosyltransferase
MEYTKEIETPVQGKKVLIKTMLTGAEREQVEGAQFQFVQTKDGKEFTVSDMKKVATAQKHELLRVAVISIDGDVTECFARLQAMYEPDYEFVYEQILAEQKKMMPSTSPVS